MEQEVTNIMQNLRASQDRQKIYADKHRVHRYFSVGDHVYQRVRPRNSSLKLGSCVKISPRYCGPFEVLERIQSVSYRLCHVPTLLLDRGGDYAAISPGSLAP